MPNQNEVQKLILRLAPPTLPAQRRLSTIELIAKNLPVLTADPTLADLTERQLAVEATEANFALRMQDDL